MEDRAQTEWCPVHLCTLPRGHRGEHKANGTPIPTLRVNERGGQKADVGKPMPSTIEAPFLLELAKLGAFGVEKYEFEGWKKLTPRDMYDALARHMLAARMGERVDSETGVSHWVAVAFNAMALHWFETQEQA